MGEATENSTARPSGPADERLRAVSLQLHGPSGPTSYQPTSYRAEWSRTERSRKQEPARRCRDRVVQTERLGREAFALTSSGQVAIYRNSLVFLLGILQQLVVRLWRWSGILFDVTLRAWSGSTELFKSGAGNVLRVCGAVSSSGTVGACFRSWSLKRCWSLVSHCHALFSSRRSSA